MPKNFFSRIKWREVLTFMLFFVFAASMWFGHAMRTVRNTRVPVFIHYTGKPGAIGLGPEGLPDTVMIEVRDAGQRLNGYLREPLHLTIDLRTYIHGEKGTIHIPSDALRRSISDILQGTSKLIETNPEAIKCSYYTEKEKTVSVVHSCQLQMAKEYQLVGEPKLNRTKIKLYGPEKALQNIDTVTTQSLNLTNLSDTTDVRLALAVPQGMRAETDSVTLRVIAERFTEKKFTVPLEVVGVPAGYRIRLFPNEVEVSIRVGMNQFGKVHAHDIHAFCTYTQERIDKMEVELLYANPYITAAWAYPGVVEFILEQ